MTHVTTQRRPEAAPARVDARVESPPAKLPPHDVAAEAGVIGSIILDQETLFAIRQVLTSPGMFFDPRMGICYRILCELADVGVGTDAMILHSTLRTRGLLEEVGGIEFIKDVCNSVPTCAHAMEYASIVREKAVLRLVISVAHDALRKAYVHAGPSEDLVAEVQANIGRIAEADIVEVGTPAGECLEDVIAEIHEVKTDTDERGLPTGLAGVDALVGGLKRKHLIALCGHGKHGKTALGLGIVATVGLACMEPVAVISFEMTKQELTKRLLLWTCEIPQRTLRSSRSTPDIIHKYTAAQQSIRESKIIIDDDCPPTLADVRTRLHLYRRRYDIKLGMIDYYQLMEGRDSRQRRYDQLVEISRGLKKLAVEMDMPILVLAQLNAEAEREDRLPRLNDIEECKRLGKDANTVMLLDREYMRKRNDQGWVESNGHKINRATLDIAGLRGGAGGLVELEYDAPITKFRSLV